MKTANFGSVSTGTMRYQDLLPAFANALRELGHRSRELTRIESRFNRALRGKYGEQDAYFTEKEGLAFWDLGTLEDMLNEHTPPYAYFGAHEGDGEDYGFWLSSGFESEFEGLKVDDLSRVPKGYTGEVLHVNDHGNMTLYWYARGRMIREVWALV